MAIALELDDFKTGYKQLVDLVIAQGDAVSPRGQDTRELRNVTFELQDPRNSAPLGVGRNLPTKIVAAEAVQLLAGVSDLRQLDAASNGNFSQFSDDGEILSGAYGPRIYLQLRNAIRKLAEDQDTRQAGVTIWRGDENAVPSKDVPCTVNMFFSIRNGCLHMSTFMRSNDVWLGTAIDVPVFCQLQAAVAAALEMSVGSYTHTAVSLHLYERNLEAAMDLTGPTSDEMIPMLVDDVELYHQDPAQRWEELTDIALGVKTGMTRYDGKDWPGVKWFVDKLDGLERNDVLAMDRYFRDEYPSDQYSEPF